MNPFYMQADICAGSNLMYEANMYKEIGQYYKCNGAEKTKLALLAHIETARHPIESWGRLFFNGALSLIVEQSPVR